jgi:hypothetical protein
MMTQEIKHVYFLNRRVIYIINIYMIIYEKTSYKNTIFVSENLYINLKIYVFS